MSLDVEKNDSGKIFPEINIKSFRKDKLQYTKKEQYSESSNSISLKKINYLKPLRPLNQIKISNYNLIKMFNLKKEEMETNNNEIEINYNKKNYSSMNNKKYLINLIKNKKIKINDYKIPLLNRSKSQLFKNSKSKNEIVKDDLNEDNTYNSIPINKKQGNFPFIFSAKIKDNSLLLEKLSEKEKNNFKRKKIRNKHHHLGYSPSSAYISFSNVTNKNNNSIMNLDKIPKTSINNSIKRLRTKLNLSSSKEKKDVDKPIFISNLNNNLESDSKRFRNLKQNEYIKKWDLPKSFSFDKVTGRQKKIKNPIKLHLLERFYEYSPNYDSISCNENKSFVKYDNDKKNDFKHYKINATRKYLFNIGNIMNSPSNNYNIIQILNEQKQKEQQKIEKKKLNNIFKYFNHFHKTNVDV